MPEEIGPGGQTSVKCVKGQLNTNSAWRDP